MSDMLRKIIETVSALRAEQAEHPEREALMAVMRKELAWSPDTEPALRKLAEAILAAGFGPAREARAQALEDAAAAAEGMHEPPAPDCQEWADWLRARAAAERDANP